MPTGDEADREPPTDDLAVGGHVGADAEDRLGSAGMGTEPRDELVEHERRARGLCQAADVLEELAGLQLGAAALNRLDQEGRELVAVGLQVVERGRARVVEDDDVVEHARRDARGDGHRAIARGANEDLVEDPVVGAGEHRDSVPAADCAGEAYGGGDRLGSGVAESHAFHSDHGCDAGGDLSGERRLGTGLDSLLELCLQRLAHEGGVVAEQDRPEAVGEIDVLVPVDVPQPRAGGTGSHDRVHELLPGEAEPGDGTGIGQMRPMGRRRLLGAVGA